MTICRRVATYGHAETLLLINLELAHSISFSVREEANFGGAFILSASPPVVVG
jgi:hypothetical protein